MVYLHETACPCKYSREKRKECISYVHQRRSRKRTAETENMSWKDRAWYVWEYYKFHLLAVILVIGVLSTIGTMIYRQTFTTRLSVAIINDRSAGASSSALLESELREYMGCGKKGPD